MDEGAVFSILLAAPPVHISAFDFDLPPEAIAQEPPLERDGARLLVLDRAAGTRSDRAVRDLPALLEPGDLLVLNRSRIDAKPVGRLLGQGHAVEGRPLNRLD